MGEMPAGNGLLQAVKESGYGGAADNGLGAGVTKWEVSFTRVRINV